MSFVNREDIISNQSSIMKNTVRQGRDNRISPLSRDRRGGVLNANMSPDVDGAPMLQSIGTSGQNRKLDMNEFSGVMSSPGLCGNNSILERQDDIMNKFMQNLKRKMGGDENGSEPADCGEGQMKFSQL